MKKKGKTLAACLLAAVWWGIFYPELCFTEETCAAITPDETQTGSGKEDAADGMPGAGAEGMAVQIDAAAVWRASGDEIVIGSRFLEWCGEKLPAEKD